MGRKIVIAVGSPRKRGNSHKAPPGPAGPRVIWDNSNGGVGSDSGAILLAAVASYGMATAFYGASQLFVLSLFFLALLGASDTVSTILRNTIRQLSTPDHLRGRMTSVNMIFFMGGPQLGNLEAGIVAALFGAPFSVISGGVATVIVVGLVAWLAPQLREYQGQ